MHRVKRVWQWIGSTGTTLWQQTGSSIKKIGSLRTKAKLRQGGEMIPLLAVGVSAAAFGIWQHSIGAALFAGSGLVLLAGIHNNTQRILNALRHSDPQAQCDKPQAGGLAQRTAENNGALDQAIGCLNSWLANEVSLTEDNAKECCAVLVDSLAPKARAATGSS